MEVLPISSPRDGKPGGLPRIYWIFWFAILLASAIEFCITLWAAEHLENSGGMDRPDAALMVSVFLGGTLAGRGLVSRLLRRYTEPRLLGASLLVAAAGFLPFWLAPSPLFAVAGLAVAGLGVAGLFPILNALALASAPERMVAASGRVSLAIGLAILLLPILLGRLADLVGIRAGYSVVAALIVLLAITVFQAEKEKDLKGRGDL